MASFAELTPSGSIDGVNSIFTWAGTSTSVELYRRGLLQSVGTDFTLTVAGGTSTASFVSASIPQSGDSLVAWIYTA